jgi:hypothetical protein
MSELTLIENVEQHAFMLDYIYEFQAGFISAFPQAKVRPASRIDLKRQLMRVFRNTYRYLPVRGLGPGLPGLRRQGKTFSVMCGNDFAYCLPECLIAAESYLYLFDAWPRDSPVLVDWVRLFGIKKVFVSALQSTELLNRALGEKEPRGIWVPEGFQAQNYFFWPYDRKDIDVMEFGRRHEPYHQRIVPSLRQAGHVHHDRGGRLLNASLARTKVSICFPSNITHPERAEFISSMTLRYLQSMASKCLVVGAMPHDMRLLFDYPAVIEADPDNPDGQLLDILKNFGDYVPLIEKNHETVVKAHQWSNRMETIRQHIQ